MTYRKILIIAVCLLISLVTFASKTVDKSVIKEKMYFFGVARNYTDSIACLTDIIPIDTVSVSKKTNEVVNIEMYTSQLEYFFKLQGLSGYICATFTAPTEKAIEKLYLKLKKRIDKDKGATLKMVTNSQFKYEYVNPNRVYRNELAPEKEDVNPFENNEPEQNEDTQP